MSLWAVVLVAWLAWLQAPPISLADASRREALRRQLAPASVRRLTNEDVERLPRRTLPSPPSTQDDGANPSSRAAGGTGTKTAGPAAAGKAVPAHDEQWWRDRMAQAREALDRDQLLSEALQNRIDGLSADWSARDDPAQRRALADQRERALHELDLMKERIAADRKDIADTDEEARRQDVPPGWLR